MEFPMIRLELQGMKQTILHAFRGYQLNIDKTVKESLDRVCSDGGIERLIDEQVREQVEKAVKSKIKEFFGWGDGSKAIEAALNDMLNNAFEDIKQSIEKGK